MPEERARQQLEATQQLKSETAALRKAIEDSPVVQGIKDTQSIQRNILALVGFICLCLICTVVYVWHVGQNAQDAADQAKAAAAAGKQSQVVNCQNNNESRKYNRYLWDTILSFPPKETPTAKDQERRLEFTEWMHDLYAPRDCSQLDKKYDLPPPPKSLSTPR